MWKVNEFMQPITKCCFFDVFMPFFNHGCGEFLLYPGSLINGGMKALVGEGHAK